MSVLMGWYDHFHVLGRIGTGRREAERLTRSCIASTLRSRTFRPATSGTDHAARVAEIELGPEQVRLIEEGVIDEEGHLHPGTGQDAPPPSAISSDML